MSLPLARRWARLGPTDRRWLAHVPEDGVCLSAFVFVRGKGGAILLGQPRPHLDWPEKGCMPLWRLREVAGHGEWTLPASHLLMNESPSDAAVRIARDWAGIYGAKPRLITVTSELMPTGRFRRAGGQRVPRFHWAVCFLYEQPAKKPRKQPPGWAALRAFGVDELRTLQIGRGHRDLLRVYARTRKEAS